MSFGIFANPFVSSFDAVNWQSFSLSVNAKNISEKKIEKKDFLGFFTV